MITFLKDELKQKPVAKGLFKLKVKAQTHQKYIFSEPGSEFCIKHVFERIWLLKHVNMFW